MLALWNIFAGSFVLGLSGAMMPGPLLTYVLDESAHRGPRAGPLTVLGHALLEALMVALLALGVARLLNQPWVLATIAFAGGVVLLWMAVGMLRQAPRLTLATAAARPGRLHPVVAGVVISLANPYWTFWWVSIGVGYVVVAAQHGWKGVATFFAGHILADLAWYSAASAAMAGGRRLMSDRIYRGIVGVCGVLLLGFGAFFLWSGFRFLS
jgi:threonine/homoserine/homoserine lactone efflux protein